MELAGEEVVSDEAFWLRMPDDEVAANRERRWSAKCGMVKIGYWPTPLTKGRRNGSRQPRACRPPCLTRPNKKTILLPNQLRQRRCCLRRLPPPWTPLNTSDVTPPSPLNAGRGRRVVDGMFVLTWSTYNIPSAREFHTRASTNGATRLIGKNFKSAAHEQRIEELFLAARREVFVARFALGDSDLSGW